MVRQNVCEQVGHRQRTWVARTIACALLVVVAGVLAMAPGLADAAQDDIVKLGLGGTGGSMAGVSADGRYVVFTSSQPNVIPGQTDTNDGNDVFLYDRLTATTTLVSHVPGSPTTAGNHLSQNPVISADGAFIAFASDATNLVTGVTDTNDSPDVFLYERATGTITLVSHASGSLTATGNSSSFLPVINQNGAYVAFFTRATNLVTGLTGTDEVMLYERSTGSITLVSHVPGSPTTPGTHAGFSNSGPQMVVISADGNYVAFQSRASNLVSGVTDTNGDDDIFVFERSTGTVSLVSHDVGGPGNPLAHSFSQYPSISADGAFISFTRLDRDAVTDDPLFQNVFLYQRSTGTVTLVSQAAGMPAGIFANDFSGFEAPVISADGRYVAFDSQATDIVPGAYHEINNVFLYDRVGDTWALMSHVPGSATTTGDGSSGSAVLSANGAFAAFVSNAANLVPGDAVSFDVYAYEVATGTVTRVSHLPASTSGVTGSSGGPIVSGNGSVIVFESTSEDLVLGAPGSPFGAPKIFVYERAADPNAPQTVIDSGPPNPSSSTSATFTFHGTPGGAAFECSINLVPFSPCTSPQIYSSLPSGPNFFRVRAIGGGLLDPSPALHRWVVSSIAVTVTSPNGGEVWPIGSTQNVTWNSAGFTGNVKIEVSRNGGAVWTTIISSTANDGVHAWRVLAPASTQARIRVTSLINPAATDTSDANFTIGGGSITVTVPNGGEVWPIGSLKNITWSSTGLTGNVKIEVSRNGGSTWLTVIASTPNDGLHPWTVLGPASTQARIRVTSLTDTTVSDASGANFTIGGGSITINTPNGGETFPIGSVPIISWGSSGLTGNVKIELSRDGGTTWTLITGSTLNDGSHPWTVKAPATTQARIRVTSLTTPTVSDTSNANFTMGGGSLNLTAPNGGEVWPIGSTRNITWASGGLTGNVKIEWSANGGATWFVISSSTLNDGVHPWVVKGPATTQLRVRITSVTNPAVSDTSNANATTQ